MKCATCKYEWIYSADWTSSYSEHACMKTENDLYGIRPEDVENCEDYEEK